MPNWKTYESSVRLLAAIIAAHPGLKLNYEETAKYYGDGAGYKTIWSRCAKIKDTAQALRDAVDKGIDPHTVSIDEVAKSSPLKTKGENGYFGVYLFLQKSDTTFWPVIDVQLEIAKHFGSDCTKSGIEWQFRAIKAGAKLQAEAVKAGADPKDVNLVNVKGGTDSKSEIALYYEDCTASALEHRFRPIKKQAAELRTVAIAKKYGEGATAKAISTRFERLKKEPHANLENSFNENEATPKSARVRNTPKSGGRKTVSTKLESFSTVDNMTQGTSEDDEDELYQSSFPSTPSKKANINKVQSGRITKAKPNARNSQVGGVTTPYILDDDHDAIKAEMSGFNMSGTSMADPYQDEDNEMNMVSYSNSRMGMGGLGIGNGMGLGMMMGGHQYAEYDDEHEA
ncbi:hypothetical protein B7463_g10504, partial [Scytalidium lignicola]